MFVICMGSVFIYLGLDCSDVGFDFFEDKSLLFIIDVLSFEFF